MNCRAQCLLRSCTTCDTCTDDALSDDVTLSCVARLRDMHTQQLQQQDADPAATDYYANDDSTADDDHVTRSLSWLFHQFIDVFCLKSVNIFTFSEIIGHAR